MNSSFPLLLHYNLILRTEIINCLIFGSNSFETIIIKLTQISIERWINLTSQEFLFSWFYFILILLLFIIV